VSQINQLLLLLTDKMGHSNRRHQTTIPCTARDEEGSEPGDVTGAGDDDADGGLEFWMPRDVM